LGIENCQRCIVQFQKEANARLARCTHRGRCRESCCRLGGSGFSRCHPTGYRSQANEDERGAKPAKGQTSEIDLTHRALPAFLRSVF
jgi:hypothetical protein